MTNTIIFTNLGGPGVRFTYAAAGDALVIIAGVTVASTNNFVLSNLGLANLSLTVQGTLITASRLTFSGDDAFVHIAATGVYESLDPATGNGTLNLTGPRSTLINDGSIFSAKGLGVLFTDLEASIFNTGTISGVNGVNFGNGSVGSILVNSGTITGTAAADSILGGTSNIGVLIRDTGTLITNLAGGAILSLGSEGAGVLQTDEGVGTTVRNYGLIQSAQSDGVRFEGTDLTVPNVVENWGTIAGGDAAVEGGVAVELVTNRGVLNGRVALGDGNDVLDNRGGVINGSIDLGGDNDTFLLGAGAETAEGGAGNADLVDARGGAGGVIDLLEDRGTGLALGDQLTGFERVFGSASGADTIFGNASANVLAGNGGRDVLDGDAGNDTLIGGRDVDTLTGGIGNDQFQFRNLAEIGDVVLDFRSVGAGNDDTIAVRAVTFGGGLVAGALAASQFQSRADNVAQDGDDRFIFRTTDRTLWFDVDGTGVGAAVLVADLQANATMTALDIVLF